MTLELRDDRQSKPTYVLPAGCKWWFPGFHYLPVEFYGLLTVLMGIAVVTAEIKDFLLGLLGSATHIKNY